MMKQNILILEDEPAIADTITYALETEGFLTSWTSTCLEARKIIDEQHVSLMILDVGLPDGNGFEFCKEIRKKSDLPIIFLTARKEEVDRVVGFEIGGDDYVVKPFSPRELASRVKAILRRMNSNQNKNDSMFHVDDGAKKITYFEQELDLSRYEYRLLKILISKPGWVYSRDKLMEMAWDEPGSATDRTIDSHIKSIRQKLKNTRSNIDPIKTHRGEGYSLQEN